jgi:drug/metabolite transporter (DMT)-like permease
MTTMTSSVIIVVVGCMVGAYGGIMMKKGADSLKLNIRALFSNKYLIAGGIIYIIGTLTYIYALKGAELSVLYPLVATTYIWVALLSQKLLGEKMNTYKWLGIVTILAGVSFIGLGSG